MEQLVTDSVNEQKGQSLQVHFNDCLKSVMKYFKYYLVLLLADLINERKGQSTVTIWKGIVVWHHTGFKGIIVPIPSVL
jgi:hypothetical protein